MSKKINYGDQLYSSSTRTVKMSCSQGSFIKLEDIGSLDTMNTTDPTVANTDVNVSVSLSTGSSDMSGTISFDAGTSGYTATKICDFTFEIPKTTIPQVFISPIAVDCVYFENQYIIPTTAGFSFYRRNTDALPTDTVGKWSYFVVGS